MHPSRGESQGGAMEFRLVGWPKLTGPRRAAFVDGDVQPLVGDRHPLVLGLGIGLAEAVCCTVSPVWFPVLGGGGFRLVGIPKRLPPPRGAPPGPQAVDPREGAGTEQHDAEPTECSDLPTECSDLPTESSDLPTDSSAGGGGCSLVAKRMRLLMAVQIH